MNEASFTSSKAFPPRAIKTLKQGRQCGGAWTKIPRVLPSAVFKKNGVLERMAENQLGELEQYATLSTTGGYSMTAKNGRAEKVLLDGFLLLDIAKMEDPEEVFRISISERNLEEVVEEDLEMFTNLYEIKAGNNRLPFAHFGVLKSLAQLDLGCNSIEHLTVKRNYFQSLVELDLGCNKLSASSIVALGSIPKLKVLDLSRNGLTFLPLGISFGATVQDFPFSKLETMRLGNNRLTHATTFLAMANLPNLVELDLSGNLISLVPNVKHELSKNKKSKLMPTFCNLDVEFPCLKKLDLSTNQIVNSGAFVELTRWKALEELVIFGNPITSAHKGLPGPLMYHLVEERGVTVRKLERSSGEKPSLSIPSSQMYKVKEENPETKFRAQGLELLKLQYGMETKVLPPIPSNYKPAETPVEAGLRDTNALFDEESTLFATQNTVVTDPVEDDQQFRQAQVVETGTTEEKGPDEIGSKVAGDIAATASGGSDIVIDKETRDISGIKKGEGEAVKEGKEIFELQQTKKSPSGKQMKQMHEGQVERRKDGENDSQVGVQNEEEICVETEKESPQEVCVEQAANAEVSSEGDRPDSIENGIQFIKNEIEVLKEKLNPPQKDSLLLKPKSKKQLEKDYLEKEAKNKEAVQKLSKERSLQIQEQRELKKKEMVDEYVYQMNYEMAFAQIPAKYHGYEEFLLYDEDDVEYDIPVLDDEMLQLESSKFASSKASHFLKSNATSNKFLSTINKKPNPHLPEHSQNQMDVYNKKLLVKGPLIERGTGVDIRMATRSLRYALNNPLIFSSTFRETLTEKDIPKSMGTSFTAPVRVIRDESGTTMKTPTSYAFSKENFKERVSPTPEKEPLSDLQGKEILSYMGKRSNVKEYPLGKFGQTFLIVLSFPDFLFLLFPAISMSKKELSKPKEQKQEKRDSRITKPPVEKLVRPVKASKEDRLWEQIETTFKGVKVQTLTRDMDMMNMTMNLKNEPDDNSDEEGSDAL